ncbi:MAG: hypothetical protein AAF849_07640 [Bacteroidota bacterium]
MLKILILVLSLASCNHSVCNIGKDQVLIALNALHSRNILSIPSNKLSVSISKENIRDITLKKGSIQLQNKSVQLANGSKSWIQFLDIDTDIEERVILKFKAGEAGYSYMGDIIFVCEQGKLVYSDLRYISAIE